MQIVKQLMAALLICVTGMTFAGCAGFTASESNVANVSSTVKDVSGDVVSLATNRFGSHERIEIARAKTARQALTLRAKETELEIAKARAEEAKAKSVQIVLDTPEKIKEYSITRTMELLLSTVENMIGANKENAKVAQILAANGRYEYDTLFTPTKQPKGAVAEGIDSLTGLAETPGVTAAGIGYGGGQFLRGLRGGLGGGPSISVNGDNTGQLSIENSSISQKTGGDGTIGSTGGTSEAGYEQGDCPDGQLMYDKLGVCLSPESIQEREAAEACEGRGGSIVEGSCVVPTES